MPNPAERFLKIVREIGKKNRSMLAANVRLIARVVAGQGPDKDSIDPLSGARVVVNMAAVHVPAFCKSTYQNTYDRATTLGTACAAPVSVREFVDGMLESIPGAPHRTNLYFGALELNGTGIRFYGDICLVLKADHIDVSTPVLEANSYDLVRPPLTRRGVKLDDAQKAVLEDKLKDMYCTWGAGLTRLVALKVSASRDMSQRRLTTGQISELVLSDEDYLEVLMGKTFTAGELQAARLSPADAAAETHIGEQLRSGPAPTIAELEWRKHRRAAVKALRKRQVPIAVSTTSGRVRT